MAVLRVVPGPDGPLDHEALLTLARKVDAAASDNDAERLRRAAEHLLGALTTHVRAEASDINHLPTTRARSLRHGQQRLLDLAAEIVGEADDGCSLPAGRCRLRTEELLAYLTLQARDERLQAHDPAA
jgi:hypothetical protein